jgi:hypothetical protein
MKQAPFRQVFSDNVSSSAARATYRAAEEGVLSLPFRSPYRKSEKGLVRRENCCTPLTKGHLEKAIFYFLL